eukprot:s2733_g3.t1
MLSPAYREVAGQACCSPSKCPELGAADELCGSRALAPKGLLRGVCKEADMADTRSVWRGAFQKLSECRVRARSVSCCHYAD